MEHLADALNKLLVYSQNLLKEEFKRLVDEKGKDEIEAGQLAQFLIDLNTNYIAISCLDFTRMTTHEEPDLLFNSMLDAIQETLDEVNYEQISTIEKAGKRHVTRH